MKVEFLNSSDDGCRALVIFDVDGTLFKTHTVSVPAMRRACDDMKLPPPDSEEICSWIGASQIGYMDWARQNCISPAQAAALEERADELELQYIEEYGELFPGIIKMLSELKAAGLSLGVCSYGRPEYVRRILESQGIAELFDSVRTRSMGKTKVEMVRELLLSFHPPVAIVIGDRESDVKAARINKVFSIFAAYGYGNRSECLASDATVAMPTRSRVLSEHSWIK